MSLFKIGKTTRTPLKAATTAYYSRFKPLYTRNESVMFGNAKSPL